MIGRNSFAVLLVALAAAVTTGCGTTSDGLSNSQIKALNARVTTFLTGLNGANAAIAACKSKGGDLEQRSKCVGSALDDAAGHVDDLASYSDGLAASTGGKCQKTLTLFSKTLTAQARLFSNAADQARSQQIKAFMKSMNGIRPATISAIARSVEKECG